MDWGPINRPLTYSDELRERILLLFPTNEEERELNHQFPLAPDLIKFYQDQDPKLQEELHTRGHSLTTKVIEGSNLLQRATRVGPRIVIPSAMKARVLDWYHDILIHPGETRMEASIRSVYTWKNLRNDVRQLCKECHTCQMSKKSGRKKYGQLPAKEAECLMWSRVNVDLWGPATVNNKDGKTYKIHVMTMIDPTTGWFELASLRNGPTALEAQRLLDSVWLAHYILSLTLITRHLLYLSMRVQLKT